MKSCSIKSEQNMKKIWSAIFPCISGYLIKKSYFQLKKYRIEQFFCDYIQNFEPEINKVLQNFEPEIIEENEYVELRIVGTGSLFKCVLIYHIEKGALFVMKRPFGFGIETQKLVEREIENYSILRHPLFPKFYGIVDDKDYIIIEFINGKTLENPNELDLTLDDKIRIILELIMIFYFFYVNKMIYRDLKPNNVMIDENKTVVLIDFDRLIGKDNKDEHTLDVNSDLFIAPEIVHSGLYSYKSDIYSLGQMFKFLMDAKTCDNESIIKLKESVEYMKINQIINKCTNVSPENRPTIIELIQEFHKKFESKFKKHEYSNEYHINYFDLVHEIFEKGGSFTDIKKQVKKEKAYLNEEDPEKQFKLGVMFSDTKYIYYDLKKAIFYYSLAAEKNHVEAQYNLGYIYHNGPEVLRDINKAIFYYSLAADQNHMQSQLILGSVYLTGIYIAVDIRKGIYYLSLAANQNNYMAQFLLGGIYNTDDYGKKDINKAIDYYLQSANQNYQEAQYNLGLIYSEGQETIFNMNKAIYYLSLAANQNHPKAQFKLGMIYYKNQCITPNINKAIHYLSLSANQNNPLAQLNLGIIYSKGQYVKPDINKAIYYYVQVANQNNPEAQCNLGIIYSQRHNVEPNINKADYSNRLNY